MSAIGSAVQLLIQAATVIVGWVVVHKLSSARDAEKARRDMVVKAAEGLESLIDEVFEDAVSYHVADRDSSKETSLKLRVQDATMRLTELSCICAHNDVLATCRADIASLRKAITGKHFEDEHDAPLAASDERLQVIADAFLKAKRGLMRLRHVQYKSN